MNTRTDNKAKIAIDKHTFSKWSCSILAFIAVSAFPVFFLYFQNADEARFSEVIFPLLIFICFAAVIFVFFLLLSKYAPKAAIITSLFMMVLLNYAYLETGVRSIFQGLRYWHILPIFLFILAHIAWFIYKKVQKELANTITLVICIVFCGLILFNGIMAAPTIFKKISLENKAKEQKAKVIQVFEKDLELPNIYYLIFDEYSSFNVIQKYYGYDNSEFKDFLISNNFSVSTNSHNNSIMTTTVITNILNLDYLVDDYTSTSEKRLLRQNAKLYQLLKDKGYKIIPLGNVEFLGFEIDSDSTNKQSMTVGGATFRDLLLSKTVVYPFYKYDFRGYANKIIETIDYLCTPNNFDESGIFTIMHLDCPHPPFVFDKNGQRVSDQNYINYEDKRYYLGQYIFITDQIERIVKSILKSDPNCIVILQSDHSFRFLKDIQLKDASSILNAVYFQGETIDIDSLSGLNTLITVLNKLFSLDILLKDDNYGKE